MRVKNALNSFKWVLPALALLALFPEAAFASGSISLSLNSLDAITVGDSTTLTATVTASGDTVSNVQASVSLPSGLTTSDSATQSIGSLSAGQSSSVSWNVTGSSAGTYTITVTASGDGVSSQTANASLVVNSAGFITVSETTRPASSLGTDATTNMVLGFSNTGGSTATVTVSVSLNSGLSLTNGSSSISFDINAGQTTSQSWTIKMTGTSSQNVTVAITSSANNPDDLLYTISGPSPSSGGGSPSTSTPSTSGGDGGGGSGGGAGGAGNPEESRLVRVASSEVEVGEEEVISAKCDWDFGCLLYVNDELLAELQKSEGFQEFTKVFEQPGTYEVKLYNKGTINTLVALKTIRVSGLLSTPEGQKKYCGVVCNDNNPCTNDFCDTTVGNCRFRQMPNGSSCGENMACRKGKCEAKTITGLPRAQEKQVGALAFFGGLGLIIVLLVVVAIAGAAYWFYFRKK